MEFGLSSKDVSKIRGVFGLFPAVDKVIIYGSRAKGNYKAYSDIDLTLVGGKLDLTYQFRIETALDDLLLPYKIDLSILADISNPDVIDHIYRIGKLFYERPGLDS